MARIKTIYNDNGRLGLLTKAAETAENDKGKGITLLSDKTVADIQVFLPRFEEKMLNISDKASDRSKEVREKNEALTKLDMYMRDTWEVLKRRVSREQEPNEVLTYYELPLSGVVPKSTTQSNLLALAAKMIQGDSKAVAKGYPAMVNPSAEELAEVLEKAKIESSEVAPADQIYDMAQEELEQERLTADKLITNIIAELRFNLRERDPASQRRIMERYGIQIIKNQNESEDTVIQNED